MSVLTCKRVEAVDVGLKLHWEYSTDFAYWRYNLAVFRSKSEAGPFEKLVETEKSSILEFVDYSTSRHPSVFHYYKLQFIDKETKNAIESDIFSQFESQPNLIADDIRNNIYREYVLFKGEKVIIYKIRRHGELCDSFDPVRHTPKQQNCKICYDTGYIGGYYNPIYSYADFTPQPDQISNSGYGDIRQGMQAVTLPYYPLVHPGDIIITKNHVCYEVTVPTAQTMFNKTLMQFIQVKELAAQNVVYNLPVTWDEKFSYGSVYYDYKMDIPTIDETRIDNIILPEPIIINTIKGYSFDDTNNILKGTNLPDLVANTTEGSIVSTATAMEGNAIELIDGACAYSSDMVDYVDNRTMYLWAMSPKLFGDQISADIFYLEYTNNQFSGQYSIFQDSGSTAAYNAATIVISNVINSVQYIARMIVEVPTDTYIFKAVRHYTDNGVDKYKAYVGVPGQFFIAHDLPVNFAINKEAHRITINNSCQNGLDKLLSSTGPDIKVDSIVLAEDLTDLDIYNEYVKGCALLNLNAASYIEDCASLPVYCVIGN